MSTKEFIVSSVISSAYRTPLTIQPQVMVMDTSPSPGEQLAVYGPPWLHFVDAVSDNKPQREEGGH